MNEGKKERENEEWDILRGLGESMRIMTTDKERNK
jgi:hypothetical protein